MWCSGSAGALISRLKYPFFYLLTLAALAALLAFVFLKGERLEIGRHVVAASTDKAIWDQFREAFKSSLHHPIAVFLAQIAAIILVARSLGWLCRRIGQPAVIGEIVAGILLGPSLMGWVAPEFSKALFPPQSFTYLQYLSQVGLILFMFVIGSELDLTTLRHNAQDAIVISHVSIVLPFGLGAALAYFAYAEYAPPHVQFMSFALFMGIGMSITAFPVLARIVQERNLQRTRLGTIAITCAAADDVTAWCILAIVIALVKAGTMLSALFTVALAVLYVLFMILAVKPALTMLVKKRTANGELSQDVMAILLLMLVASAYAAEVIGIHALFGAFMAGVIIPERGTLSRLFAGKVEDISLLLLLPLFFVFTGLRTQIGLLGQSSLWLMTLAILGVAIFGKFFGSALAARYVGQSWRDSLTIGALMNTRGLMELVVLNIGYDLGVLTTEIFSMMIVMALVTTFMTGPAISLIEKIFPVAQATDADPLGAKASGQKT